MRTQQFSGLFILGLCLSSCAPLPDDHPDNEPSDQPTVDPTATSTKPRPAPRYSLDQDCQTVAIGLSRLQDGTSSHIDPLVVNMTRSVKTLCLRFNENPGVVGDQTVVAHKMLTDAQVEESFDEILKSMTRVWPGRQHTPDGGMANTYAECLTLYVLLRKSGNSRHQAVSDLD